MSKRIGLPVTLKMRHDAHYVETLTSFSGASIGRMIPTDKIRPNPEQPRKALGDLRELTDSIREKGVLEPLLVRFIPREDTYYIISGERRYHASKAAGLHELPCIEKIADDAETLELGLIENLQRKDLTPFEVAHKADHPKGTVGKCDFCADRVAAGIKPKCVETCPAKARFFGDLDDPNSEVSQLITRRGGYQLRADLGTNPSVYYLPG